MPRRAQESPEAKEVAQKQPGKLRSSPEAKEQYLRQLPGSEAQNSAQEHDRDLGQEQPTSSWRLPEACSSLTEVILFMMAGFWMPNKF